MKWKAKRKLCNGDERIKSKFLIFPKEIGKEVRWLERVKYLEKYTRNYQYGGYEWVGIKWLNN